MKYLVAVFFLVTFQNVECQVLSWQNQVDSVPTLSSPRAIDLTGDNVKDVIIGGGTDGVYNSSGVIAFDGVSGDLLWTSPSRNELFGSPLFQDISGDGIEDIFITGREAQFLALDGSDGSLIWDFFPNGTNPADSGWYNFYNPQRIHDVNDDSFEDFLVTNGGDHTAPEWETNRPPGHLMVLSAVDGSILAKAVVPDSAETYCSPVVCDLNNDGNQWVLFGTGGENLGGHFYACPLTSVLNNTMDGVVTLASDSLKGFIAPSSVVFNSEENNYDIYVLSYDGKLQKFSGSDFSERWSFQHPNTESSAAPVIGNFTGEFTPDVFLTLFKGIAPSYSDFYQVMLDGLDGTLKFIDSLGQINYSSGNAVDLNQDGRDEAVVSVTYFEGGYFQHRLEKINFETNTVSSITTFSAGVNLGSSPLITDMDFDGSLDLVYANRNDSLNPVAWNGITLRRMDLEVSIPNSGVAWGSYLGSGFDGRYNNETIFCGDNSVVSSSTILDISCNGFSDGAITTNVLGTNLVYNYHWSNGSISPGVAGLQQGIYQVNVTDGLGCMESLDYLLGDPYEITFGAIAPPTCPGDSDGNATLSSSGCPCMFSMCTFLWENGETTKPNDSLVAGWNSVIITHTDGCIVEDSVLVPEPLVVVDSVSIENVRCFQEENGMLSLVMDSTFIPYNIIWSNGETDSFIDSLAAGTYQVWVEDVRGCLDSIQIDLSQPESLILQTQHSSFVCSEASDGYISFSASGGTEPYSFNENGVLLMDSLIQNLSAGMYMIEVLDSSTCSAEVQLEIIELEPITVSFETVPASGEGTLDGIAVVTPGGGLPPFTYNWSSLHTDSVAVYLNSDWYSVTITDSVGCTYSDSVYVGILNLELLQDSNFKVYPNPTNGGVYLNHVCDKIDVYSHDGKLVLTRNYSDYIDLSSLVNGLYYLSLRNKQGIQKVPIVRISN